VVIWNKNWCQKLPSNTPSPTPVKGLKLLYLAFFLSLAYHHKHCLQICQKSIQILSWTVYFDPIKYHSAIFKVNTVCRYSTECLNESYVVSVLTKNGLGMPDLGNMSVGYHPHTRAIFTSVASFNALTKSDTIPWVSRPFHSKSRFLPIPRGHNCHRAVLLSDWT
jgi:hypothetical protein